MALSKTVMLAMVMLLASTTMAEEQCVGLERGNSFYLGALTGPPCPMSRAVQFGKRLSQSISHLLGQPLPAQLGDGNDADQPIDHPCILLPRVHGNPDENLAHPLHVVVRFAEDTAQLPISKLPLPAISSDLLKQPAIPPVLMRGEPLVQQSKAQEKQQEKEIEAKEPMASKAFEKAKSVMKKHIPGTRRMLPERSSCALVVSMDPFGGRDLNGLSCAEACSASNSMCKCLSQDIERGEAFSVLVPNLAAGKHYLGLTCRGYISHASLYDASLVGPSASMQSVSLSGSVETENGERTPLLMGGKHSLHVLLDTMAGANSHALLGGDGHDYQPHAHGVPSKRRKKLRKFHRMKKRLEATRRRLLADPDSVFFADQFQEALARVSKFRQELGDFDEIDIVVEAPSSSQNKLHDMFARASSVIHSMWNGGATPGQMFSLHGGKPRESNFEMASLAMHPPDHSKLLQYSDLKVFEEAEPGNMAYLTLRTDALSDVEMSVTPLQLNGHGRELFGKSFYGCLAKKGSEGCSVQVPLGHKFHLDLVNLGSQTSQVSVEFSAQAPVSFARTTTENESTESASGSSSDNSDSSDSSEESMMPGRPKASRFLRLLTVFVVPVFASFMFVAALLSVRKYYRQRRAGDFRLFHDEMSAEDEIEDESEESDAKAGEGNATIQVPMIVSLSNQMSAHNSEAEVKGSSRDGSLSDGFIVRNQAEKRFPRLPRFANPLGTTHPANIPHAHDYHSLDVNDLHDLDDTTAEVFAAPRPSTPL